MMVSFDKGSVWPDTAWNVKSALRSTNPLAKVTFALEIDNP
jgi:hypothetical protein